MSYTKNSQNIYRSRYLFKQRLALLTALISIAFLAIVGRFFYIQIFKYDFYKGLSENNRIVVIPNVPNRGLILDRNGIIMADNYIDYNLEISSNTEGFSNDDKSPNSIPNNLDFSNRLITFPVRVFGSSDILNMNFGRAILPILSEI